MVCLKRWRFAENALKYFADIPLSHSLIYYKCKEIYHCDNVYEVFIAFIKELFQHIRSSPCCGSPHWQWAELSSSSSHRAAPPEAWWSSPGSREKNPASMKASIKEEELMHVPLKFIWFHTCTKTVNRMTTMVVVMKSLFLGKSSMRNTSEKQIAPLRPP